MRRRDFLLGSTAALGLAGCGRTAVPRPPSPVNITRAAAYSQDIYDTMRRVLAEHKLNGRGRRVVIETQPGGVRARKRHQPHPMLVHATLEAFRELGAAVAIAEGPGHRRSTLDLAAAAGYFPPALALAAYRARERPAGLHAQDEDGPIQGRPQPAGVIVSGHDPVAVDATCCRIMQIKPSRIEYLTLAGGLEGIAEENIQQIGEKPDSVETRFDLIMELRELRRARA